MDLALNQVLTSNYSPGRSAPVKFIFLHATRGPGLRSHQEEYELTVKYFLQPSAQASAHYVVGPQSVTKMVMPHNTAWHARFHNGASIGIEIAQPAEQPPFTDWQYLAVAELCRRLCEQYNIPKVRLLNTTGSGGIIGHEDSEAGRQDGKTDPGPQWDWPRFLSLLNKQPDTTEQDWQTIIDVTAGFSRELESAMLHATLPELSSLLIAASKQLRDVSGIAARLQQHYKD